MTSTLCQLAGTREMRDALMAARRLAYLAVLLGFATAVPELQASCGDYVMIGGDHGVSMNGHVALPMGSDSTLPPSARCQGPNCHRQAPAPTSPSREPPTLRSTDRACWLAAVDQPPLAVAWIAIVDAAAARDGYRLAIEHPPRLAG